MEMYQILNLLWFLKALFCFLTPELKVYISTFICVLYSFLESHVSIQTNFNNLNHTIAIFQKFFVYFCELTFLAHILWCKMIFL